MDTLSIGVVLSLVGLVVGAAWTLFRELKAISNRVVKVETIVGNHHSHQLDRIEQSIDKTHDLLITRPCLVEHKSCEKEN